MILPLLLLGIGSSLPAGYGLRGPQLPPGNVTICPGECVHSLAAILCDHIIEELPCNEVFLKCCVSKDLKLGTPVETSPPLPDDYMEPTRDPEEMNEDLTTSVSEAILKETNVTDSPPLRQTNVTSEFLSDGPLNNQREPCPGHCIEKQYARFCSNLLRDSICESGVCCSVSPTTSTPSTKTTAPQSFPSKQTSVSSTSGPTCPSSCVSPLFSLLCDEVMENFHCPNEGRCCLNKPETTEEPSFRQCPGSCIPTFLSGVCNKPSKLILQTSDCNAGTICCFTSDVKDSPANGQRPPSPPVRQKPFPPHRRPVNHVPSPHHSIPHLSTKNPQGNPGFEENPATPRPLEQPFCPGPCIASFLKFTCFGANVVHVGFFCAKVGSVCCAPLSEIQKYEHLAHATDLQKESKPSETSNPLVDMRPSPYVCGIKGTERRETPRVIGGTDSIPGEWCWQVALINAQNQYLCGGALIGIQWVLTAAHCVTNLVRNGDVIYVRIGDHDLTSQYGSRGARTHRVATTYVHHSHNSQTLDNDIALLKLQTSVDLDTSACLVCLPARGANRQAGKRCIVTGYGYQGENGPISLKIRQTELPIVDDQECSVKINAVTEKLFILPAGSFCAGGERGNDACQGDGGGPLVCQTDDYYQLTGLVSWGFGCGREDVPGVYVKVSAFVGWINQIISVNA
ncbi:protein masquerade-like [Centruroides vittatus]|uniref:protein masquerade-like n=1 Tax=Centruroides vittatus TaxID=120091 RepID=UPI00350F8591